MTVIATGFLEGNAKLEEKTGMSELPSTRSEILSAETVDLNSMDDIEIPTFLRRKLHQTLEQAPA